ncbi:response regulator [Mesorhizobium sp. M0933]|uniref:response regulator n=2 Tax=Mesorhizobium TaxID=68287 RepID=UPI003334FBE6
MGGPSLKNRSILIATDNFALAFKMKDALEGANVIYPVNTIEDALDLIMSSAVINCALLGVNLQGEATFVAADHLMRRQIPFVFLVGHNASDIPDHYGHIDRYEEPIVPAQLIERIESLAPSSSSFAKF